MNRLPLTTHADPGAIVAWRTDGPVTLARFLGEVGQLADRLPAGASVLNVCQDRYRFLVGFSACLAAGRTSLLPSSHTPEAVRQLRDFAPDVFCLHDGNGSDIDLPGLAFPDLSGDVPPCEVPMVPAGQTAVVLFTSGSTGAPVPQAKTWGSLIENGRAGAERLGFGAQGPAIVGTVPAQHSYGFESTILLVLQGGCSLWHGRPFYPADIVAALDAVPRPRMLVTTPFHLRTLLDARLDLPTADLMLSATAPLSADLARVAEAKLGGPLMEIYGCTEAGQLASRRTVAGPAWQPLRGIRLEQEDGTTYATGGYVPGRQPLGDVIELQADGRFILHGRNADVVNIAGKRTSLAFLNHQLAAVDGVVDGSFFLPDEAPGGAVESIGRLCAFVVAPTRTTRDITDALRRRIDPIFLPRPLIFLERMPRNATGKLPRGELQALLDQHRRSAP